MGVFDGAERQWMKPSITAMQGGVLLLLAILLGLALPGEVLGDEAAQAGPVFIWDMLGATQLQDETDVEHVKPGKSILGSVFLPSVGLVWKCHGRGKCHGESAKSHAKHQ